MSGLPSGPSDSGRTIKKGTLSPIQIPDVAFGWQHGKVDGICRKKHGFPRFHGLDSILISGVTSMIFDGRLEISIYAQSLRRRQQLCQFNTNLLVAAPPQTHHQEFNALPAKQPRTGKPHNAIESSHSKPSEQGQLDRHRNRNNRLSSSSFPGSVTGTVTVNTLAKLAG